ncbi:MAG TPA: hypothetical protein PKJ19_12345 [Flavobacteriales bacterium]|nr:hypothetical protein [Flavobacteriales bacterium]
MPFRDGQAVAVWQDERNGGSIYAQPIQIEIASGITETPDAGIQLLQGAEQVLLFQRASAAVDLRITDLRDSLVHAAHLPAQAEGARVELPMNALCAGLYTVSVSGTQGTTVWKVVRY